MNELGVGHVIHNGGRRRGLRAVRHPGRRKRRELRAFFTRLNGITVWDFNGLVTGRDFAVRGNVSDRGRRMTKWRIDATV